MFDAFHGFSPGNRPNRATPVRNSESTYLNHSETTPFASRSPGPSCYKDGVFSNFVWFCEFSKSQKIASGANSEGFGAPRGPLDLPSRAACWVLWVGFSTWCEALSYGELFSQNPVKKRKSTDLHESVGNLHFKLRRIRICQRFCRPSRFGGCSKARFLTEFRDV